MKEFFFCLALAITGCTSVPTTPLTAIDGGSFLQHQSERQADLHRVRGKARLRYQAGGKALSGQANLVLADGDLRLEVRDPVGTLRYFLVGKKKSARAYYQDEQVVYGDELAGERYFNHFLGVPLTVSEFGALLVGNLPTAWQSLAWQWKLDASSGLTRGEGKLQRGTLSLQVSPTGLLERVELKTPTGNFTVDYSDFDACCSRKGKESILAHAVRVRLPRVGEELTLDWDELNLLGTNINPHWFGLEKPRGAKLVMLND